MVKDCSLNLKEVSSLTRKERKQRTWISFPWGKVISFVLLTLFCILWISPFILLFTVSLRNQTDAVLYPSQMIVPHSGYSFESYKIILFGQHDASSTGQYQTTGITWEQLLMWTLNSCGSAIGGTALYLLVACLAAYAFTFIDYKYRNVLFAILVGSMVIPGAATTIGNQTTVFGLGWHKVPLLGLILPGLCGVYGMYLIKTFFSGIPKDLIESARMDGYSNFKIFTKIVYPLGKTAIFVQALFGFMGGWNDLVWPEMLYRAGGNKNLWTLQVGMSFLLGQNRTANKIGVSLAGGVICILPVMIVYLISANKIVEGMAGAGVKR